MLFRGCYRLAPSSLQPVPAGNENDTLSTLIRDISAAAVYYQGHYEFGLRIPHLFPAGHPDAIEAYRRMAKSHLASVRVMGLAGQIREGDAGAMEVAVAEVAALARSAGKISLNRTISAYRGCYPASDR